MPIGVALTNLRTDLRAETGQSLNVAQGVQSQLTQDNQLNRQQLELWEAYDWPHLRYWVDVMVVANQDIYDYPDDMPFDQINFISYTPGTIDQVSGKFVSSTNRWTPLAYGIHGIYSPSTPQSGTPKRWGNKVTVTAGKTNPVGQLQLLPIPAGDITLPAIGALRFEGQAPCNPLVADDDICVLDSKAIVLFAAAEILAVQKQEAAQLKLAKAQNFLRKLLSNSGADKRRNYNMGGSYRAGYLGARPYGHWVPGLDYIPS